jgi:hypothetical protein
MRIKERIFNFLHKGRNKMKPIKEITIQDIHSEMEKKGMVVFTEPYSVTLGGVRSDDAVSNKFNDILFSSYWDDKGKLNSVIVEGTTDTGITARLDPNNKDGVAIIQHDVQHRGVYQYQNPKVNAEFRGHKGQEAFRQIKKMKMWRDNNKDSKIDFGLTEEFSLSFTNGHNMGNLGVQVNNWSEGCWGATVSNMNKLYAHAIIQDKNGKGSIFSYALLHQKDF